MARPRITLAVNWEEFEKAVHKVFIDALKRLSTLKRLPAAEPALNLELYWLAQMAHHEQSQMGVCHFQFTIEPDSTSKPQLDDSSVSPRLRKRPDFACTLRNMNVQDYRLSQVSYYLECKRLGKEEHSLNFNDLYSEKGIARFMTDEHQYAKGCQSGTMIGFIEDMPPDKVFSEVNKYATVRLVPSLTKAISGWHKGSATMLPPVILTRSFDVNPIKLHHIWVDLRHCSFDVPSNHPPQSAGNLLTDSSKKSRLRRSKRTG